MWRGRERLYRLPDNVLNLRIAIALLIVEILGASLIFVWLENYSFREAFYMTIITISTVGFEEVRPLSAEGQIFVSGLILLNVGIFAYIVSVFTYHIQQGNFFKKMHRSFIDKTIAKLKNHVILCGYGRYGSEIFQHLKNSNVPLVVIENDQKTIEEMASNEEKMLYLEGDATHEDVLIEAGIHHAHAMIAALSEDAENAFTVMTARQLNPQLNIISRAHDPKSLRKIQMAGADHVIMPEQIGGFYMATLVTRPRAIDFLSFITSEIDSDVGFEEVQYDEFPEDDRKKSIRELALREKTGATILGIKNPKGLYTVNPGPDFVPKQGCTLILFGDQQQLERIRKYFGR